MADLSSFSQPAGILTAVNSGALIAGGIWVNNKISERCKQMDSIQEEIKKYNETVDKLKLMIEKMDKASVPKLTIMLNQLTDHINNVNHRLVKFITTTEEKNAIRDRNMATIYEYMKSLKPMSFPVLEEVRSEEVCIHHQVSSIKEEEPAPPTPRTPYRKDPEDEEDSDIAAVIRMASGKK
jgi:hypothetical protein